MHEEYKHLMTQQVFSAESALLHKLEQHTPKRRMPASRKILIAALCLCLLIPTAVLAAETIFDLASVNIYPGKDFDGNDAVIYDIDFGTVKELPLSDFPEKWQHLPAGKSLYYDSWADAQEDLGIDLMDNTVLDQEYTPAKSLVNGDMSWKDPAVHCYTLLRSHENQLYSFTSCASYKNENHYIFLSAEALVEHPNIPEDVKKVYTGDQLILKDESDAENFHTETYTAASGLVATITSQKLTERITDYTAVFRANSICYHVSGTFSDDSGRDTLIHILEGFVF